MNILFLASAWRASLIKAFKEVRRLKKWDFGLIAADSDVLSPSLYFADRFHIIPTFDAPEFNPHLLDLCKKEKITAIVPLSNKAVTALKKLKPDLKNMDIVPVISPAETIKICLDKWETHRFFKKQSVPVPDTVLYNKDNCNVPIKLPLFLKKRTGEGSNDTYLIKTKEQLHALQLEEEYLIQNYIKGTEYTIDVFSNFEGKPLSVVPRERIAIRGGEVLKGKTVRNLDLIKWGAEIAEKLKICGPANIQCIKDRHGNYFFTDINLRFASGAVHSFAAGANFPEMLIKLIRGKKVKKIIGEYEENLFMLRYDEAVFTSGKEAETKRQKTEHPKSKIQNFCRVVILQPGFIPWLGFFELMYKCDIFIFFDNVQFTKRDWRSRNRIKTPNGPKWLTLPVKTKGSFTQLIKDTELDNSQNWAEKHIKTIKMNYSRAPYFDMLYPKLAEIYHSRWNLLYDLDIVLIKLFMKELGLKRKLLRSSEMKIPVVGSANEKIINICKAFGATHYYSGAAGKEIYDNKDFKKHNIVLEFQEYRHPEYRQLWGDFMPYLSIIDLVFNHGSESLDILL